MKILIGMSGGVDSSFAALSLLREQNEVEGILLKMHDFTSETGAIQTADSLGIPLHVVDCRKEFEKTVVENFKAEYLLGRTPNPCILCNREVKFRFLLSFAEEHGFDRIATGHYAGTECVNGRYCITRGEEKKDQSYMLARLTQEEIAKTLFPIGQTDKAALREEAEKAGLPTAKAADSQEICFVPNDDYAAFIASRVSPLPPPGNFIDEEGKVLGVHRGILHYTVGQRKGLGIALGVPHYVSKINAETNEVTLTAADPLSSGFSADSLVFQATSPEERIENEPFLAKIRYSSRFLPVRVSVREGVAHADFESPQRAVTPGQSAVFYRENRVCFSGIIR